MADLSSDSLSSCETIYMLYQKLCDWLSTKHPALLILTYMLHLLFSFKIQSYLSVISVSLQLVFTKLLFLSFTVPGMEGTTLSDANLTNSYFSSSFIGVNGFGSPAESKYSMMQVQKGICINVQHVKKLL